MGKATQRIVRTERVEVVDDQGRVRVVIGTLDSETGMVGVTAKDSNGRERGFIVTDDFGCEVGVTARGNNVVGLRATYEGNVEAFLTDPRGHIVGWLDNAA